MITTKKQPRFHQVLAKELISGCFQRGVFYPILCMPTGSGKTVSFADMAGDCIANGWPVLVMCHRIELIDAAEEELNDNGLYPRMIVPGYRGQYSNLYLASVDTLRNHPLPDVKVAIIDECHIRAFDEIALKLKAKGVIVIGCTASPIRDGKAFLEEFPDYTGQLSDIYEEIVTPTTVSKLLSEGFLVPALSYGPEVDLGAIKTTSGDAGKDYQTKALYEAFNKPKLYAGVVDNYIKLASGMKALCFNVNVEHSIKQTEEFNLRGIKAEHVDGKTPKAIRRAIFERLRSGDTMVVNNCGIATTGTNIPVVECIIANFKTKSLAKFMQVPGRGARPCPEIGKTHFVFIDQGGNIWEHGFWQDEREFTLDHRRISKTLGAAPIKECPNCKLLMPVSTPVCPECQQAMINKKEAAAQPTAEFTLLEAANIPKELKKEVYKMTIPELEKYRELKEYKLGWVVRQLYSRGDQAVKEYAQLKGYTDAWVWRQIKEGEEIRVKAKEEVWQFITDNPHLDDEAIKAIALKKLKASHNENQINILMPKILENAALFKISPELFL